MMLTAVNIQISYSRLQKILGLEDVGIPYSRLRLLSRVHPSLRVTLEQGNLEDLRQAIAAGTPPVIFVLTSELPYWSESVYHAVVVVGYSETEFYLHDPAFTTAPQVVSTGNLDLAWLENDSYFAVISRIN